MLKNSFTDNKRFPAAEGNEWPMAAPEELSVPELPAGQKWPRISIVTPSFNQGDYLERTIRSVLLQGYPSLEYIIIDGGSTDESLDIIRKYEPWIDFWLSETDRGQSHAINKGMEKATGDLLSWLNSDDWFLPGALFKMARAYLEDPSVGVVYGQGHIVNKEGKIIYTPKLKQATRESLINWCFGNNFMQPSSLIARQAWSDFGPLDEQFHYTMDVNLFVKIAEKYRFRMLDDVLTISLSHGEAKTTIERNNMHVDFAVLMMRYGNEAGARKILDEMAGRLNWLEEEHRIIKRIPLTGAVLNFFKKLGLGRRTEL